MIKVLTTVFLLAALVLVVAVLAAAWREILDDWLHEDAEQPGARLECRRCRR